MNTDQRLTETTLHDEQIFSGRVLNVRLRTVELPSGGEASREIILHNGAAAVVAVDDRGRVALVRQYRAALERIVTEIPAGKRDAPDEDPLLCAKRELREETGLTAERWRRLTVMQPAVGYSSEEIWLYLATGLTHGDARPDEDEFLAVEWMDFAQAVADVRGGRLGDSKTALGLLLADAALRVCRE